MRVGPLVVLLLLITNTSAQTLTDQTKVEQHVVTAADARSAFERFKKLEGKWRGRSTNGWEEVVNYKTIAKGSVVVANSFDAHPNETMQTMYYLDQDRLMLTHFCVARNQPRLVVTQIADEGKTITFTFLDATNLAARSRSHGQARIPIRGRRSRRLTLDVVSGWEGAVARGNPSRAPPGG